MAVALRGYYDASWGFLKGTPQPKYVTLAGYAGTDDAWRTFEARWGALLGRWIGLPYIHTSEAFALQGPYSEERGWSTHKVHALFRDVFNNCFSRTGWDEFKDEFVSASCTVNLDDYRRLAMERPVLQGLGAETICALQVIPIIYRLLPEDPAHPLGHSGDISLYFDRDEPFEQKVRRVWEREDGEHMGPLQFVSHIGSVSHENVYGVQAADVLAWYTNRVYTHDDLFAKLYRLLNTPSQLFAYMDYDELLKRYGGYGPDELTELGVTASPAPRLPSAQG